MRKLAWMMTAAALAACGGGSSTTNTSTGGAGGGTTPSGGAGGTSTTTSTTSTSSASTTTTTSSSTTTTTASAPCGGACPAGTTCGTANGLEVCRATSGIPRFTAVYIIVMENISLSTLHTSMNSGGAPNFAALAKAHAAGTDYHGVVHPSLPNYIAMTSGDTHGIGCDCKAAPGQGSCNVLTCNLLLGSCSCNQDVPHLGDQLEAVGKSWMAFGDGMGSPCNTTDSGSYAQRHIPFLYYDNVHSNAARCNAHVVDYAAFDPASPAALNFIAPDLVHDMHDPFPAGAQNITNGDTWIGPEVAKITGSAAYKAGGLLVVLWDEDDNSGGITGSDDPVGIFVMSPFAKSAGYVSTQKANHYSLLATIDDGLGLPRLGKAASPGTGFATTLADYFPAN
jgi:hypothetical protein